MIVEWPALKQFVDAKNLSVQYVDYDGVYTITAADGSVIVQCTLTKSNKNDYLIDFETNYKPNGNRPANSTRILGSDGGAVGTVEDRLKVHVAFPTTQNVAIASSVEVEVKNDSGNPLPVNGTVTANIGATNGVALDSTLTNGSQKAVVRGGTKGTTAAADVTSTNIDSNSQALDVALKGNPLIQVSNFPTYQSVVLRPSDVQVNTEFSLSTRVETNIPGMSYTVTAGKTFFITAFSVASDSPSPVAFRIRVYSGATLVNTIKMNVASNGAWGGYSWSNGIKIATGEQIIRVTIDPQAAKGSGWVMFAGFEV